jgi:hypothetical protein
MTDPKLNPTTNDQMAAGMRGIFGAGGQPFAFPLPRDPLRPKKAAIIGTQPSSRGVAPYGDPTWAIWGSSPGNMGALPRVDAWFECHVNLLWPEYRNYGEPYLRWLREQPFPVVCWDRRYLPNAVIYPRHELVKRFGPFFFSSTFAWMMAYAIHVGVEEMGLYGVDMSSKDEYIQQRPGGHYFIQRAQEAGIKVTIPDESDLMQPPPLYGWSESTPFARKMAARWQEVNERLGQAEPQAAQIQQQVVYLRGARENMDYMRQVWAGVADMTYFDSLESSKAPLPPPPPPPEQAQAAEAMRMAAMTWPAPTVTPEMLGMQQADPYATVVQTAPHTNGGADVRAVRELQPVEPVSVLPKQRRNRRVGVRANSNKAYRTRTRAYSKRHLGA